MPPVAGAAWGEPAEGPQEQVRAAGPRRLARDLALRAVFARDVGLARPLDVLAHLAAEEEADPQALALARELVAGISERLGELDRRIAAYARNWSLLRLAAVDRSVLRLGVFELCHRPEVPPAAAIAEAVALADVYGGDDSAAFVNGILGQLARDLKSGEARE